MAIFYAPEIEKTLQLPEEESQHVVKVLRMKEGDKIEIIDGQGTFYEAEITLAHHKRCGVKLLSAVKEYGKRDFRIHIAIAPTKNIERLEWFAEKVTEIGVDEITPIICDHSERKVVKHDRLEKILISAAKQSKKAYIPKLNEQTELKQFLKEKREGTLFIAHCYEQDKKELSKTYQSGTDATLLIGPEGDFSENEVSQALRNGYIPVSLGQSRLRTETAGVVGCHTMVLVNELR